MSGNRPLQYVGLVVLILASLIVIFFPFGPKPQEQPYTITLSAPKPFAELVGKKKSPGDEADKALLNDPVFKTEKLPGTLQVSPSFLATGPYLATIEDHAATRDQAQARAESVVQALRKTFPGITLGTDTQTSIDTLSPKPEFTFGTYALFPPKTKDGSIYPAIKLGLDLQGGVNLVLQVRRALYPYTFNKKLGSDADAREAFVEQVRNALNQAPADLKLNEANVNLVPGTEDQIEVRTQAQDRNEFNRQREGIQAALATVSGVKFTPTRDPQFYVPDESVGNSFGSGADYSSQLLDRTVEIVRSRVDKLGVSEPLIQKQGTDRIIVQLPGVTDPQKAVDVIGRTAQMEIRLLPTDINSFRDPADENNTLFSTTGGGGGSPTIIPASVVRQRSELIVSGADLKPTSTVAYDENGQPAVHFDLQPAAAERFGVATAKNIHRYMPIFLDEKCISAPVINSAITGGSGEISGGFSTIEDARSLALLLNSGALPAPIDVVENRTISATLGTDSLIKSLRAGLLGVAVVALFMLAFYRLPGLLADFALVIYCVVNLAVFILIGGTLTLPGIAGFLLAIAMSLDTNILVFERLKEEMAVQPTFAAALRAAFSRAWTAILDSHVTTLIAASVLFDLGTGPVKGFALTLGIGVLLSLFSAISVTRLFMWTIVGVGERNRALFAHETQRAGAVATTAR